MDQGSWRGSWGLVGFIMDQGSWRGSWRLVGFIMDQGSWRGSWGLVIGGDFEWRAYRVR
jgi:hypothetical protein